MQHQGRSLRRRPPRLNPRPRLLIICEGRVTEPSYFRGLNSEEQVRSVDVIIDDEGGTPKTLVERAASRMRSARRGARGARDQNLIYDEVWCVFDVDEHPQLLEAKQQAQDNNIYIAVSNPCFELWLLLHFRSQTAWIHRHDVQSACRICSNEAGKRVNFSELRDRVDVAIQRANELEKWQDGRGCSGENPSTSVHRLVQRLKDLSKSAGLEQIRTLQLRRRAQ
jgi:hypothetical protein